MGSLGPLVVGERSLEVITWRNNISIREDYNYHGWNATLTWKNTIILCRILIYMGELFKFRSEKQFPEKNYNLMKEERKS